MFLKKTVKKLINKYVRVQRQEIKAILRSELRQESLKESAIKGDTMLIDTNRREDLVVSLTTFGKRINSVYIAIESIAKQTIKPSKIVLWLSEDSFNDNNIPLTLMRLKERGLSIFYRKDVGPHTKLIYALEEYPNSIIVTIDDDIIYEPSMIEEILNAHAKYPEAICCHRAHYIKKKNGVLLDYDLWEHNTLISGPSHQLMATGVGGVLYPNNCFNREVFNIKVFKEFCPSADDIWFKIMAIHSNRMVYNCASGFELIALDSSKIGELAQENSINKRNDVSIKALLLEYNIEIKE